jgi:competence ComEA-like helix-hairpin-helix protein
MEGGLRSYTTAIVVGFLLVALSVLGLRWHALSQQAKAPEPAQLYSYAPPKRDGSGSVPGGQVRVENTAPKGRGVSPREAPVKPAPVPATAKKPRKSSGKAALPAPRSININTATQAQLELLPGIGPSLASRIISHRNEHGAFATVDALDDVKGIGPKKLEDIAPYCFVE